MGFAPYVPPSIPTLTPGIRNQFLDLRWIVTRSAAAPGGTWAGCDLWRSAATAEHLHDGNRHSGIGWGDQRYLPGEKILHGTLRQTFLLMKAAEEQTSKQFANRRGIGRGKFEKLSFGRPRSRSVGFRVNRGIGGCLFDTGSAGN